MEPFRADSLKYQDALSITRSHLEEISELPCDQDIRFYLEEEFLIRRTLQNSKLL